METTNQPQDTAQPKPTAPRSAAAIVALVLGIIALVTSFLPIINNFSFVLALVGAVFAVVALAGTLRGKKSGKGLAIASAIVCVLSIVIVLATQNMYAQAINDATSQATSGSSTQASAPASDGSAQAIDSQASRYAITDEAADDSNPYFLKITGTLTNNGSSDASYVQVSYNLYDESGAQVGTAYANTSNLKAGGSWKFEAVSGVEPSKVASWECSEVTGF